MQDLKGVVSAQLTADEVNSNIIDLIRSSGNPHSRKQIAEDAAQGAVNEYPLNDDLSELVIHAGNNLRDQVGLPRQTI